MSHLPQRKDTNCLNCGADVIGKYCHNCGQENSEPQESVWHLVLHFFTDITHFDGKFFSSLKDILVRPGFLSKEYMAGRRAKHLNPIRMYLFTSFIFFLIFFSTVHIDKNLVAAIIINGKTIDQVNKMPPEDFVSFTKQLNNGIPLSRESFKHYVDSINQSGGFTFTPRNYKSRKEYDSLLATGTKKHNWLERQLVYRQIELSKKYGSNRNTALSAVIGSVVHHFPQMLFISLPFAALILKLLYIRRKKFYYVSHAIFTIHVYIFIFIVMLANLGISKLQKYTEWKWMSVLNVLLAGLILFYLYKAMRHFYGQGRGKTILKYFLLLLSIFCLCITIFILFLFISIFQV